LIGLKQLLLGSGDGRKRKPDHDGKNAFHTAQLSLAQQSRNPNGEFVLRLR
jgi:hypothetical protein